MDSVNSFSTAFRFSLPIIPFPQITMGLAPLIVVLKTWRCGRRPTYDDAARFWAKIFRHCFCLRVVTGIPWNSSRHQLVAFFQIAGGVIGQTLAMEGTFGLLSESLFLGCFLRRKRLSKIAHWWTQCSVCGSWLSVTSSFATDAWMQNRSLTRKPPTVR